MGSKDEGQRRVRVAVRTEMAVEGWNIQDLVNRSKLDRKTIQAFLEGDRWPQAKTLAAIEKAIGWEPGQFAKLLEGTVGGPPEDADYVAAPGERVESNTRDDQVLTELRAMREDINSLSRRVARIESRPEPLGGPDGPG